MRASLQALEDNGFDVSTLLTIVKQCPQFLSMGETSVKGSIYFLKQYCGLRQWEMVELVKKFPKVLTLNVGLLQAKVDYLYKNLGGSSATLLKFPQYFSYDLMRHIIPRCEFLRSEGKDPTRFLQVRDPKFTLRAIMTASPAELESIAGNYNQGHIYETFQQTLITSLKRQR